MKFSESNDFLRDEIQGRWPEWKPTAIEIRDWCGVLGYYDIETAGQAMFNYVKDATKTTRRPQIGVFIAKAKLVIANRKEGPKTAFTPQTGQIYGEPARDKAFKSILDGTYDPDQGRSKRWLMRYLESNPALLPSGMGSAIVGQASSLPESPASQTIDGQTAIFQPNPDWVGPEPLPPEDDLPF